MLKIEISNRNTLLELYKYIIRNKLIKDIKLIIIRINYIIIRINKLVNWKIK